jgi:uncharacterized membrane protein
MWDKLKSRKLLVFVGLVLLIVSNYLFQLGMPASDVLSLVILGGSYILGQGFVDAKRQSVQEFPTDDVAQSVVNIIQAELKKLGYGNNISMEHIIKLLTQK